MFHRWEAQQVEEARITPATSEQCSTVVSELQSLIFDPSDAEALPRMLQALDNARFCHPQMQAWRSFASCYASQNPWDLFNAAEHYFHQHEYVERVEQWLVART